MLTPHIWQVVSTSDGYAITMGTVTITTGADWDVLNDIVSNHNRCLTHMQDEHVKALIDLTSVKTQ